MSSTELPTELGALATAAFRSMPLHAAIVDAQGRVILTNEAWDRFGNLNGAEGERWNERNYLEECSRALRDGVEEAGVFASGLRSVLDGHADTRTFVYNCDSPDERRVFRMVIGVMPHEGERYAVITHDNVTPSHLLENDDGTR